MSIEERGKALEEAFFAKKNKELLGQVKHELDAATQRDALKEATGITDDDVLDRVLAVGVTSESLTAMSIAPMVLVGWADSVLDTKERDAIQSGAEQLGIKPDSTAGKLLQGWLTQPPEESLLDVWIAYTKALCDKLQPGDQISLSEQVLGRSKKVAEAAGGFLGLGSISPEEHAVLDALKAAFE